jgi:DDE superfamily endonuclease
MPELLWRYLTALLYSRTSSSCVALAEALETVSHDRLTRLLQASWSGHTLLELACRTLFVGQRGYLIIDDTVVPKPFATAMEGLAWVFSSQERRPVYGFSLVLLVWTDGMLRIPIRASAPARVSSPSMPSAARHRSLARRCVRSPSTYWGTTAPAVNICQDTYGEGFWSVRVRI